MIISLLILQSLNTIVEIIIYFVYESMIKNYKRSHQVICVLLESSEKFNSVMEQEYKYRELGWIRQLKEKDEQIKNLTK